MSEKVACPECGKEYKSLGTHWWHSPDHRPRFTDHQHEVVTGVLMGDGSVVKNKASRNPWFQIGLITKPYLEYFDDLFGCLSTGVRFMRSAEDSAKQCRKRGFNSNAKTENYSDVYWLKTRSLPELHQYRDWYLSGEKVWPENIELTPTVLKHWFCTDGHFENKNSHFEIRIEMSNERKNKEKVNQYFTRTGIPEPSRYDEYEREDGSIECKAAFNKRPSEQLFEYMGEPLPGFEYKWPESYRL